MLLTGVDTHLNGLGNMDEWTAPNQWGLDGYEGYLKDRVATLPQLLEGAGSYWDMTNFTAVAPESVFTEKGRYITQLPEDYYATKTYTDKLIGFIDESRTNGKPFFAIHAVAEARGIEAEF